MGLYDREYAQDGHESRPRYAFQMGSGFGGVTPAVKWLLIANGVVFLAQLLGADGFLTSWLSVWPGSWGRDLQVWRLVSYQFLHDAQNMFHILLNMLGLFFLGPTLEQHWGTRRFLGFYLGCGVAGGLLYVLLSAVKVLAVGQMIGASGAILGLLAACAILFPHFVVILIVFPVPIRVAAVILIFIAVVSILGRGVNAGGEAAHLGGMAAGAAYVWSRGRVETWTNRLVRPWQKRRASKLENLDREVDRILQKVHESGIHSLTWSEKATLRKATETEQQRRLGH
jgi:membrane associated rhomboid family serine protease